MPRAYDESAGRYRGLRCGQVISLSVDSSGLVVKSDPARKQIDAETTAPPPSTPPANGTGTGTTAVKPGSIPAPALRRFHGTVRLDPARVGRDASRIADEVIAHLAGPVGSEVMVTLEIDVSLPEGAPDQLVRTVTENSRTLKFTSHGFESE